MNIIWILYYKRSISSMIRLQKIIWQKIVVEEWVHKFNSMNKSSFLRKSLKINLKYLRYFNNTEIFDYSLFIPLGIMFIVGVYDDFYKADFKLTL